MKNRVKERESERKKNKNREKKTARKAEQERKRQKEIKKVEDRKREKNHRQNTVTRTILLNGINVAQFPKLFV